MLSDRAGFIFTYSTSKEPTCEHRRVQEKGRLDINKPSNHDEEFGARHPGEGDGQARTSQVKVKDSHPHSEVGLAESMFIIEVH